MSTMAESALRLGARAMTQEQKEQQLAIDELRQDDEYAAFASLPLYNGGSVDRQGHCILPRS